MGIERILSYISIFIATLIVIPFHEFAHAFVAVKCGDYTPKLNNRYTLNPLAHFDPIGLVCLVLVKFGWAKPVPINPYNFKHLRRDYFLVSIAGVTVNYILAFIAYPLFFLSLRYLPNIGYFYDVIVYSFYYVFYMGITLFVFNLIPIYPLDGFRVLESFTKRDNVVISFLRKYSTYILFALIALGYLASRTGYYNLDLLGRFRDVAFNYVSYPITSFWGLIF